MKKLWIIVVAVMVSAFALTGCGGSADVKSVESAQSAASSSTAELAPSSETPAPTADEKATITIQDDKNGIAVQKVAVGEQVGSGNGGTKAVVYVAYEASIGQGWQTYDDLIEIDLRNI